MAYDNLISRTDASAVITENVDEAFMQQATDESAALQLMRRVPVNKGSIRFPVISALPTAAFVGPTDSGLKQTTEVNWANKYLQIEEIATIVPIPDSVRDDMDFDVWGAVKPLVVEAIGRTLDGAVFFGINKPTSWPTAIVPAAIAAGNTVSEGTATQAKGGLAEDINQVLAKMEADGYDATGFLANRTLKGALRGLRDTSGQKLLDVTANQIEGINVVYAMRGLWPTGVGTAKLIAVDRTEFVLGIRQDVTVTFSNQAVVQDGTGAVQFNAFQQDLTMMRVVFRVGWQVANTINYDQPTEASQYPASILAAAS